MQKKVWFYNRRGERLSGLLFFPPSRKKLPAVVICHGFTSSKYTKIRLARNIYRKGFAVLIFDASGCGESGGSFEDYTITRYVNDLRSAVNFLRNQKFVDKKLGIAGHSLGGMIALIYAAKYGGVQAVIPVDAPYHLLKDRGAEYPFAGRKFLDSWRRKKFETFGVRITRKRVPRRLSYNFVQDSVKYDLRRLVRKIKCPVIVVQGDRDNTVPPRHAIEIFSHANFPKDLIFVSGVNHRYKGRDEKTLEGILVAAFSKFLK